MTLAEEDVPKDAARFGVAKCDSSDHVGRWVNLDTVGGACVPPYCTGNDVYKVLFDYDWVRAKRR